MPSREPIVLADMMLRLATKREMVLASAFVGVFLVATVGLHRWGQIQGPFIAPFIPIVATLWGAADLLTAFLMLTQFSVNGIRVFAFAGAAFAYAGVLAIPYVAFYPRLFFGPPQTLASEQVSIYLWLIWHIVFALIVAGYSLYDPTLRRRFLRGNRIRKGLLIGPAAVVINAAVAACAVVMFSGRLPVVVDHGHFTSLWSNWLAPSVVVCNLIAVVLVIRSGWRKLSLLQLWLAAALAIAALDGLANAWTVDRYTLAWYLGKIETLVTAGVVMLMLLSEVGAVYRSLGTMAIIDSLTGLRNRRSFDEYLRWLLGHRAEAGIAFLLLDVDFFKQYNDRYGHAAGDACLRRIADTLRDSLWRSVDLVARYGGEEFVVLLPDTTAIGGFEVAERIRKRVEVLAIDHAGSEVARFVTVSVGVAHVPASNAIDGDRLFALADSALYRAKIRRNVSVAAEEVADIVPARAELQAHAVDSRRNR